MTFPKRSSDVPSGGTNISNISKEPDYFEKLLKVSEDHPPMRQNAKENTGNIKAWISIGAT